MNRIILCIFVLCLLVSKVNAQTCTFSGTGYWSNTARWSCGGVPPFSNYSRPIIAAGARAEINDTRSIPVTVVGTSTSSIASLYISGAVKFLGNLFVGDETSGYVGRVKLKGGSFANISSNGIRLNKCEFQSYSTSTSSRASIYGTKGSIINGTKAALSSTGMNVSLSYVDFNNMNLNKGAMGNLTFGPGLVSDGIITGKIDVTNCTFSKTDAILFGRNNTSAGSMSVNIAHNDFRDITGTGSLISGSSVVIMGGSNSSTVTTSRYVGYNTFKNASLAHWVFGSTTTPSVIIERNSFYNSTITSSNGSFGETRYNSLYAALGAPSSVVFRRSHGENYHHNIISTDAFNGHPHDFTTAVIIPGGSTQTETPISHPNNMHDNIYEASGYDDNPWFPGCAAFTENYYNNFNIGPIQDGWEMHCPIAATTVINITNNTIISTIPYNSYGRLIASETAYYPVAGQVNVKNNLLYYDSTSPSFAFSGLNSSGATPEPNTTSGSIDYLDYNNYYATNGNLAVVNNSTTNPSGDHWLNLPSGVTYGQDGFGLHDRNLNPGMLNPRYGIANFTGSTKEAFFADQLNINGYNGGSSVYAFDGPTGLQPAIMKAYAPSNATLLTAGQGGTYIGAFVPVPISGIWGMDFGL